MFGKLLGKWMPAVLAVLLLGSLLTSFAAGAQKGSAASDGLTLYVKHCANCHGRLEKSLLSNRSANRIRYAIRQFPAMYRLKELTDAELDAIAAALAGPISAEQPAGR